MLHFCVLDLIIAKVKPVEIGQEAKYLQELWLSTERDKQNTGEGKKTNGEERWDASQMAAISLKGGATGQGKEWAGSWVDLYCISVLTLFT